VWTDGTLAISGGMQWFKFTATAVKQVIHVYSPLVLGSNPSVQLYDSSGNVVGESKKYYGSFKISRTLTVGQAYYIKIWQENLASLEFTYQISFNKTVVPPLTEAIKLTEGSWTDGEIPNDKPSSWSKFEATANSQYIHIKKGTLTDVYINVYSSDNEELIKDRVLQSDYIDTTVIPLATTTIGQDYYIEVKPYSGGNGGGTYKIAFTASSTRPSD